FAAPAADFFEAKVRPLLIARCVSCHGAVEPRGGLRRDTAEGLATGGTSGAVVVPGKPDSSRLIRAIHQDGDLKMPPKGRLSDAEIGHLVQWVKAGAVWPNAKTIPLDTRSSKVTFTAGQKAFWAFQPVKA